MIRRRERESPPYAVGSVGNALELLELLTQSESVRVSDLSAALAVAPSTAHRLLSTFLDRGFLRQEHRHGAYGVGPELARLVGVLAPRLDVETAARPHLCDLAAELNETVHLGVLTGSDVLFVDAVQPERRAPAGSRKGMAMPAYATAAGKALLAELSRSEIERLYPSDELRRLTRKTLSTRAGLLADLERTRERGYAIHAEESQPRYIAYGCPIRDRAGAARAAIVVAGPVERFKHYSAATFVAALKAAASAVAGAPSLVR